LGQLVLEPELELDLALGPEQQALELVFQPWLSLPGLEFPLLVPLERELAQSG
jgi:hypothetical protein